jgi:hypothetical protein
VRDLPALRHLASAFTPPTWTLSRYGTPTERNAMKKLLILLLVVAAGAIIAKKATDA